jgi:RNA polymerase sigma factor (sigma-70 family)
LQADYKLSQPTESAYQKKRNDSAFDDFFVGHYDRIYTMVFRLVGNQADAEDITQQAFLKCYHAFDQFDAQTEGTNIAGWLYRVAVNQAYDNFSNSKFELRAKNGCMIVEKMLRSKDNFLKESLVPDVNI